MHGTWENEWLFITRKDDMNIVSFNIFQRATTALRPLAYHVSTKAVKYLKIGESSALLDLKTVRQRSWIFSIDIHTCAKQIQRKGCVTESRDTYNISEIIDLLPAASFNGSILVVLIMNFTKSERSDKSDNGGCLTTITTFDACFLASQTAITP